jgi:uncharacterized protein (DUF1810 family)
MQHNKHLPCDVDCPTHGPLAPLEGDTWNLQRFVEAQDADGTYERALDELRAGMKHTHWMWFVFPQLWGLTLRPSEKNDRYALRTIEEVEAYVAHPVLGPRYRAACEILTEHRDRSIMSILGDDAVKLLSSVTLFEFAGSFVADLRSTFFNKQSDLTTLHLLLDAQRANLRLRRQGEERPRSEPAGRSLRLQHRQNGEVTLTLECELGAHGDFRVMSCDYGAGDSFEWETLVNHRHVDDLVAFLGEESDQHIMNVVERDWQPVEGYRLERAIRMSGIPYEFYNNGMFP